MAKIQNKFTYKLIDRIGVLTVVPLGESDFTIDYSRDDSDSNFDYEKQLSGKMTFFGEAYERMMFFEQSMYRCEEQTIEIYNQCDGVENLFFSGKISLNEAEFDRDKCLIVLKFSKDDKNDCFDLNKSEKIDLFSLIGTRVSVKTSRIGGGVFEHVIYEKTQSTPSADFVWLGAGNPADGNWKVTNHLSFTFLSPTSGAILSWVGRTDWVREIMEIDCSQLPDPDWILKEDNCGTTGKRKFYAEAEFFQCGSRSITNDNLAIIDEYYCKILGENIVNGVNQNQIDNGLWFNTALVEIVKTACPYLNVKSNFFQINPDVVTTTNYVTLRKSVVDKIMIFQKSDVKRPYASGNATKFETTLDKFLEIIFQVFNVKWRIIGNEFRIEHVSFFNQSNGIDVTSDELKKYFVGKFKYTYENEKIPRFERFRFSEQSNNEKWKGEIEYKNCVSKGKKSEETIVVDEATTDVEFVMANSESDSDRVRDDGFVIVSTVSFGGNNYINREDGKLNDVFSWEILIRDYLGYNRKEKIGFVNGVERTFVSKIPTKKGEKFAIPFPLCSSVFNPDDIITTRIGEGIVDSASFRLKDCMLELSLLYGANEDLLINIPPEMTVGSPILQTFVNVPEVTTLTATDADGTVSGYEVATLPLHGVISIVGDQLTYTPATDYIGSDTFSIRALDNYGEVSSVANYTINVLPANSPPVAGNETFNAYHGSPFYQPMSIFSNDSDDGIFTLVDSTLTSVQGVSVTIDPDGFFDYTPPALFVGTDEIEYQLYDGEFTTTGKIFINVMYFDRPVAVADEYQTKKNQPLTTNGTIGKEELFANDYTPNGLAYVYTTTAESKATDEGGTVVIGTTGLFTYTPPTDFIGQDSFTYEVSNANGSRTGNVTINVIPEIFVSMEEENVLYLNKEIFCDFEMKFGGVIITKDIVLRFFEDAAKSIPMNVDGLGLKVLIEQQYDNSGTITVDEWQTGSLSGTSLVLFDNFTTYNSNVDCMDITTSYTGTNFQILPSSDYTVI